MFGLHGVAVRFRFLFFFFLGSVFLTLTTVATRLGAQCRVLMSQVDSGS